MIDEITIEKLDELEASVDGFMDDPWRQGDPSDDCERRNQVWASDLAPVLIDCSDQDCGEDLAAALVAMHNSYPALLSMARKWIHVRAELEKRAVEIAAAPQPGTAGWEARLANDLRNLFKLYGLDPAGPAFGSFISAMEGTMGGDKPGAKA